MGFSIGRLLGGIAPILGGIIGGPAGALVGGAVSAAFGPGTSQPSQVGPTGNVPAQLRLPIPRVPGRILPPGVGPAIAGGMLGELLDLIFQNTGIRTSAKRVKEAVRVCGISTASSMFGLSEAQICTIVLSVRRRRARGISAADLRRTRSTIRKVHNISHDLRKLVPKVRAHHR